MVEALQDIVLGEPQNTTAQVAGPVRMPMSEFIRIYLNATNDPRKLVADKHALYFGAELSDHSLVPAEKENPRIGKIRYEDWLKRQA